MIKYLFIFILFIFSNCLVYGQSGYCSNEDFETSEMTYSVPVTLTITTSNGINGWTAKSGANFGPNQSIYSCLQTTCCVDTFGFIINEIKTPNTGFIDPLIGSGYPIFSVFGNGLNNGTAYNGFNCYGKWFTKLNNQTAGNGLTQLTKNYNVTLNNAIFKYAFITVLQDAAAGAHCCCSNSGFSISFKDCLGNYLAGATNFSISPDAGTGCSSTGPCTSGPIIPFISASTPGWSYNKWKIDSVDLSTWIGNCVTIDIRAFDCVYGGHAGYAYFDAQCGPLLSTNINSNFYSTALKIYPNPNNGTFTVLIQEYNKTFELEIRNVLGQLVYKQNISKNENTVHCEHLSTGVYSYTFLENNIAIKTGKLIIE